MQVLLVTDVSVVYGLFGNIGGALSLVVLLYGCLFSIKAYYPEIVTEFQVKGADTLLSIVCFFPRLCCLLWPRKRQATQTNKPLTSQRSGLGPVPTSITASRSLDSGLQLAVPSHHANFTSPQQFEIF